MTLTLCTQWLHCNLKILVIDSWLTRQTVDVLDEPAFPPLVLKPLQSQVPVWIFPSVSTAEGEDINVLRTHKLPQRTCTRSAPEETATLFVPENFTGPRITPLEGVPLGEPFCVVFSTTGFQMWVNIMPLMSAKDVVSHMSASNHVVMATHRNLAQPWPRIV